MTDEIGLCVHAKTLTKGAVRRFFEALNPRTARTNSLPDGDESLNVDGLALVLGKEVRGLYLYREFPSLQGDTILYYPYGGMLIEDRYTRRHQSLIENIMYELKADSKVQLIFSLDQQPTEHHDGIVEDEAFWLKLGFLPLDMQVHYRGAIKYGDAQDKSGLSVSKYEVGNDLTNEQLCHLYREAYKRRSGIPDVTPDSINEQLSIPSCSYLLMRHNDELIGQATLFICQGECYVDSIYVKRSYWGTGAADKLVQSLLNYAKTKGCQAVSGTASSSNRASLALMERFGLAPQYRVKRMTLSI
jgi:GNAT superfamily N-acetyltransferase